MSKMTTYQLYSYGKDYWVHHFEYRNRRLNSWDIDISDRQNRYMSLSEDDLAFAAKAIRDAKRGRLRIERVD